MRFRRCSRAVGSLQIRVLLTLGGVIGTDAVVAPPNVVTPRLPAARRRALPHMAGVVCHGGLSTITAALAAGVPVACILQGRDQHGNAARVAACGAGRLIDPKASAAEIANDVDDMLRDDGARSSAQGLAAEIAALGRGETATDEVERLLPITARDVMPLSAIETNRIA